MEAARTPIVRTTPLSPPTPRSSQRRRTRPSTKAATFPPVVGRAGRAAVGPPPRPAAWELAGRPAGVRPLAGRPIAWVPPAAERLEPLADELAVPSAMGQEIGRGGGEFKS